jgi:hypothetical protein
MRSWLCFVNEKLTGLALFLLTAYSLAARVKKLLASLPLFLAAAAQCATLEWPPSPTTPDAPPATLYRVYSSPVTGPASAVWTIYGQTTNTNLLIAGNVYRMFSVRAVSALGTESVSPNTVTNQFAAPNPPGTAIITGSIEGAPTMQGPWHMLATNYLTVPIDETNQFFRQTLAIAQR